MGMSMKHVAKIFVVLMTVALVGGCAMGAKGPSDEELIKVQVDTFKAALLEKNIDKLMTVVSENFYHPEVGGKAEAKEILTQGLDSGYTENGEVDLSQAKTEIKEDTATVYPITASSSAGSVTVGLTLKKEKVGKDVNWFVTMLDVEGI